MPSQLNIAVVALQGDFEKHLSMLRQLEANAYPARLPADIEKADAIVLPGGESTTIGKLMARYGLDLAIKEAHKQGKVIYGTCAGLILISRSIAAGTDERGGQPTLGLLDVTVARNAFGRQLDSFEADLAVPAVGDEVFRAVFIRAPQIEEVAPGVDVLATYDGKAVFVRQGTLLGSAFHPELTADNRIHQYFLSLASKKP